MPRFATAWANGREHCNWCADLRSIQQERGYGEWGTEPCPVCVSGEMVQIDATSWVREGHFEE